jgi:hypothetical protein
MCILSKVATRIRKLARIADELRDGADFSITRLTTVKGLCDDPEAAARFVLHLARLAKDKMETEHRPDHVEPARWSHYRALAAGAVCDRVACDFPAVRYTLNHR